MYCLSVSYPRASDSHFDSEYYANTHLPLCADLLKDYGYRGYVLRGPVGRGPGGDDLAWGGVDILFDSLEQLKAGIAAAGAAMGADVPNYTNVTPVMSFSEMTVALG